MQLSRRIMFVHRGCRSAKIVAATSMNFPLIRRVTLPLACACLLHAVAAFAAGPHVFVQLTDLHLGKPAPYETPERMQAHLANARAAIRDINEVIHPQFVLVTGDCVSVKDEDSLRLFAAEVKRIAAPVYVIPGNHDDASVRAGWFERYIGPTRMEIRAPGWHILAFDGRPLMSGDTEAAAALLQWIGRRFRGPASEDEVRALACHYPLHMEADWKNPDNSRAAFQLTGPWAIRLDLAIAEAGVSAFIAGHTHDAYGIQDDLSNATCVISAATQNGGYRIHTSDGGVYASSAAQVGKWPKVVVLQPKQRYAGGREFVAGRVPVRVMVFSSVPVKDVEFRLGSGALHPMQPAGSGVWQAELDTREAANGKRVLTVTAHTESGPAEASIPLAVGNPRR